MTPKEIADLYYNGWISKHGDLSEVPIADNFRFRGPVASFDSAEGYRAMAREAGAMVRSGLHESGAIFDPASSAPHGAAFG